MKSYGTFARKLSQIFNQYFHDAFDLYGTSIRVEFRTGDNPFKGKKNDLTERQIKKRKRLMHHQKKRSSN